MAAVASQRNLCGEVFITNNYLMILECKFCCEQFTAYDKFLNHIFYTHFDNIDTLDDFQDELTEYDDVDILNSLENVEDMEQEHDEIMPDSSETTNINDKIDVGQPAETSLTNDAQEYDWTKEDENLLTEISVSTSEISCKSGTDQSIQQLKPIEQNAVADTTISNFRPVVAKYREKRSGEDRKYKCRICGTAFARMVILRRHERRHSNSKPLACTKCSKRFFTRTELDTHIRWHTGERPFVCTYCGSGFTTNGSLNIHEKRHLGERNHKCDQCGKQFFDGYRLRIHAVVHTKERNHKCDQCQATFTRRVSLRNHMRLHENALRYECKICNMRFNQKPSLIWHEKSKHHIVRGGSSGTGNDPTTELANEAQHTTNEEYECKRCDLEFENKKSLLNHQREVHAGADG